MRILVESYTIAAIMSDRSQIPQFTGADYTGWAFKVKYGLADKKLHRVVMNWDRLLRRCRPDVIMPLTLENELHLVARGIDLDDERLAREQQIS